VNVRRAALVAALVGIPGAALVAALVGIPGCEERAPAPSAPAEARPGARDPGVGATAQATLPSGGMVEYRPPGAPFAEKQVPAGDALVLMFLAREGGAEVQLVVVEQRSAKGDTPAARVEDAALRERELFPRLTSLERRELTLSSRPAVELVQRGTLRHVVGEADGRMRTDDHEGEMAWATLLPTAGPPLRVAATGPEALVTGLLPRLRAFADEFRLAP